MTETYSSDGITCDSRGNRRAPSLRACPPPHIRLAGKFGQDGFSTSRLLMAVICLGLLATGVVTPPALAATGKEQTIDLMLVDDQLTPTSLTVSAGKYRIAIHNAFTTAKLDVYVDNAAGVRQNQSEVKAKATKGSLTVELTQGKYVIRIPQRSKWRCALTVTE